MVCDGRLGLVGEPAKVVEELIGEFISEVVVAPHEELALCRRGKSLARYFTIIFSAIAVTGSENDVVLYSRHPVSPATTEQYITLI